MQTETMSNNKNIRRRDFIAGAAILTVTGCAGLRGKEAMAKPILIAHRGASGYRPEHTLESYSLAIEQGCDFIEPDLVLTKDGHLICRHENDISETTNIAEKSEFAGRKTTKIIDGETHNGWFSEDFTLAEIKTLRCKERLPQIRPQNTKYDGKYEIPTFAEVLELRERASKAKGRTIGVYPETKHPSYFLTQNLEYDGALLDHLGRFGIDGFEAPVFIQSFEVENLKRLSLKTKARLIQLMSKDDGPWDSQSSISRTYQSMISAQGLNEIAKYAYGIGPEKVMIIEPDNDGYRTTDFVMNAHAAKLKLHPWTFRAENRFMINAFKSSVSHDYEAKVGNIGAEIKAFLKAGIDGLFSDNPDLARAAIDEYFAAL